MYIASTAHGMKCWVSVRREQVLECRFNEIQKVLKLTSLNIIIIIIIIIIITISIFQLYFSYAATLFPSANKYILLVPGLMTGDVLTYVEEHIFLSHKFNDILDSELKYVARV
jgi:hypothetical protein